MGEFDPERRVTKEFKRYRDFCRSAVYRLSHHPLTNVVNVSETTRDDNTITAIRCQVHLPQGKQNITVVIPYRRFIGVGRWNVQGKRPGRNKT